MWSEFLNSSNRQVLIPAPAPEATPTPTPTSAPIVTPYPTATPTIAPTATPAVTPTPTPEKPYINENGVAKRVFVKLGQRFDDKIEIFGEGIHEGVELVTVGQAKLVDGVQLTISK